MDKKLLVKQTFEGYIDTAEDTDKILIDLTGFEYLDECRDENGELNTDLVKELNNMLIELFEENGYDVYEEGGIYAEDGTFKNVDSLTSVAIKK